MNTFRSAGYGNADVIYFFKHASLMRRSTVLSRPFQLVFPGSTLMEQSTLKNVNNRLNINIYSYLETSCGQSFNIFCNKVPFFNTSVN
jgi:hypothetical protein